MTQSSTTHPHIFHVPDLDRDTPARNNISLVEELKKEIIKNISIYKRKKVKNSIDLYKRKYSFDIFYHPRISFLIQTLYIKEISGVLDREIQSWKATAPAIDFTVQDRLIDKKQPMESIDFDSKGVYCSYNWELFFHIPFLIACRLSQNQRFEEAQKWFHFIFNPIDGSFLKKGPAFVWQTKPFFEAAKNKDEKKEKIEQLIRGDKEVVKNFEAQVTAWRKNPFQPHLLARMRHTTYQKTVVMKYIDNLIAWGDSLFRRDTMESINEATLYYVLAAKILGRKPQKVTAKDNKPLSYNELQNKYKINSLGAVIEAENLSPLRAYRIPLNFKHSPPLPALGLYFGIPQNEKLLGYWDIVADRIYKIRNGMNIEGVLRELDLFEPPIDPALLVKAKAKGLNIREVLSDLYAPTPIYRFTVMVQKAIELCNEVKALGSAFLTALEKKEGEALALLRSNHEIKLLKLVKQIKEKQIDEIKATIDGLKKSKESATERYKYYNKIQRITDKEQLSLSLMELAWGFQLEQQANSIIATAIKVIPDITVGLSAGTTMGPTQAAGPSELMSQAYGALSSLTNTQASIASTEAGHERRWDDWKLQERLAKKEEENLDMQIAAAEIRKEVAEKEIANQEEQIKNAEEVNEYMHSKFTNEELYQWMKGQLSNLYFQVYKFAYDIAKRAEKAYQYDLGLATSDFIQTGHWDSLRAGLLAGERLAFDLKRMEMSYFENNKREYEITKNISLAALDGLALLELRRTGGCRFSITEEFLNGDFPTHIMRRIKGVSLSVPCIVGPYTSINCKLSLTSHKMRRESGKDLSGSSIGASIIVSGSMNDSGLFEFNLRDERFLPFEGMGAISNWTLKLPKEHQFDYHTISDVILHLRYTAREGTGEGPLPTTAKSRLFSIKHEFSDAWQSFLNSPNNKLKIKLDENRFLFVDRKNNNFEINTDNSKFFAETEDGINPITLEINGGELFLNGIEKNKLKDILLVFTPSTKQP